MSGFDPDEYQNVETAADEILEDTFEEQQEQQSESDQSAETEEALATAVRRIEEANLWRFLIKSDVFQEGSARADILAGANKKIRAFALQELNYLLNIGQKQVVETKVVEAKLPFDKDEVMALKILAGKVLKKDPATVIEQDRTPRINSIGTPAAPAPVVTTATVQTQVNTSNVAKPAAQLTKKVTPAKTGIKTTLKKSSAPAGRVGGGAGYARGNRRGHALPTADQLIATMQPPAANISAENISQGEMNAVNPNNLISNVVAQLTQGNVVANVGGSSSDQEDINERL